VTALAAAGELESVIERHFVRRGHGAEFEMEADWIRGQLPPGARRVVDLGCGGGALLSVIGVERVLGVDVQPDGLRHTRRRFAGVSLLCGSAERIPLADATVDAITLQHVIEHLPDTSAAMAEWFRVIRPGGTLLIQTPNAAFTDPSIFDDPTHLHLFTAAELEEAIHGAGFERVDLRTLGLPWFRHYGAVPGGWRIRRWVTTHARALSRVSPLRFRGQTLCCAARRPGR